MLKLALALLPAALMAMPAGAKIGDDDRRQIIQLEDAWRQARITRDLDFLERFYAEDMRIHWLDGSVLTRSQGIARFRDKTNQTDFIQHGPLDVSVSGGLAVVMGIDRVGGRSAGQYGVMRVRFTDVLVKRDGRWQLYLHHATRTQAPI